MKKLLSLIVITALYAEIVKSQSHAREGYDISFDVVGAIPARDMTFSKAPWDTVTYFTGGDLPASGGMKHLTKIKQGGASQSILNLNNGSPIDVDLEKNPYATIRLRITATQDIKMSMSFRDGIAQRDISKTFTVKGNSVWNVIRLDFGDQPFQPLFTGGTSNEIKFFWDEPAGVGYPYEIYFDYIRIGGIDNVGNGCTYQTGDPDSTIKMHIDTVPDQQCEKDAGEQIIHLTGISNGTNVTGLSLSQTNDKTLLLESIYFSPIQSDGTAELHYTPKTGFIGIINVHLLLTYNRGDSILKYKSDFFSISVVSDPKMTVAPSVKAIVNQPKVIINVNNATNSTGGASGLTLNVTATNPVLITNLVADPVKSDGTSKISFIPGQDQCGTDTITAVITDSKTGRSATYKIAVEVSGAGCVPPIGTENTRRSELSISPNPAAEVITVSLPDNNGGKVQIVDITGKTVKEVVIPSGQVSAVINIASLSKGMYFVSDVSRKVVKKLVVQ